MVLGNARKTLNKTKQKKIVCSQGLKGTNFKLGKIGKKE